MPQKTLRPLKKPQFRLGSRKARLAKGEAFRPPLKIAFWPDIGVMLKF